MVMIPLNFPSPYGVILPCPRGALCLFMMMFLLLKTKNCKNCERVFIKIALAVFPRTLRALAVIAGAGWNVLV